VSSKSAQNRLKKFSAPLRVYAIIVLKMHRRPLMQMTLDYLDTEDPT
jgi:hypothetical protein